jgi:hypothetical protein
MREAAKRAVRKTADIVDSNDVVAVVDGVDGVGKHDVGKHDVGVDDADRVSLMVG